MNSTNRKNVIPEKAVPVEDFDWSVLGDGTVVIKKYLGENAKVVIPAEIDGKRVTVIGEKAFYKCGFLVAVNIPESVTEIGDGAFDNCTSLASINIPDGVTVIGGYTFEYCSSLTSITIPESVKEIGESAFYGCKSLTSINLPDSVKIGENVFLGTPLEDKFK